MTDPGARKLTKSLSTPARRASQKPVVTRDYNRTLSRAQSIKEHVVNETATFFGVSSDADDSQQLWTNRRLRHCERRYGGIREPLMRDYDYPDICQFPSTAIQDPLALRFRKGPGSTFSGIASVGRSMSIDSRVSRALPPRLHHRDSVAKMAWDGLSTLVKSGTAKTKRTVAKQRHQSRSFAPGSIVGDDSVFEVETECSADVFGRAAGTSKPLTPQTAITATDMEMEPIHEVSADVGIEDEEAEVGQVASSVAREPKPVFQRQATLTPTSPLPPETPLADDVFFDNIVPSSAAIRNVPFSFAQQREVSSREPPTYPFTVPVYVPPASKSVQPTVFWQRGKSVDESSSTRLRPQRLPDQLAIAEERVVPGIPVLASQFRRSDFKGAELIPSETQPPYLHGHQVRKKHADQQSIWSRILSRALSRSKQPKRRFGEGVLGRCLGRTLRHNSELSPQVRQQLDDFQDYRPYFTYWVTTVQILVTVIALFTYGIGPVGFQRTQRAAMVLQSFLVREQVAYSEQENFWIGPSYTDLVHLGAKYSPCMRRDQKIWKEVERNAIAENHTACCIANDKSFCVQTTKDKCTSYSTWHKWGVGNASGPDGRQAGSVCGQDPRSCKSPASTLPFEWPDDLTKWPICHEAVKDTALENMKCELTGRPCCIGIHGECRITTREFCDFVKGYFHEEALLCSQVSCLEEVCGMVPFVNQNYPDQFYRLFIAIFLHAGMLHCAFTVVIQYFLMRDLEKLIGCARLAIIYLCSGIGGNLASAIFVPYQAEVGPAGSQFGLLSALFVDAIYSWEMIVHPWKAIGQLVAILLFLLLIGLLPWIDNWAHTFGFLFGLLLSMALFPYIQFRSSDRMRRMVLVVFSLIVAVALFVILLFLFYMSQDWTCEICGYFNCIPFVDHFCDNKGMTLNLQPI